MMNAKAVLTLATLAMAPMLHGCAAGLIAPALAGMNLSKNGPVQLVLEGTGDARSAFRRAAIDAGGTIPRFAEGYVEAQFPVRYAKAEFQEIEKGRYAVMVTTTSARSWDFEDGLMLLADSLSASMGKAGFATVERKRESGL